jgi:trehalose-6-phosphatase
MKQKDIKVGALYRSSGSGRTIRKVLEIIESYRRNHAGVLYEQKGWRYTIHLKSFAKWAGSEVTTNEH